MIKICEICNGEFETKSSTRIYCYDCSGESTRNNNDTRKHQKTILRRSMKIQAIKLLGGKCSICGYNKCIEALEFHHENPDEKVFKLLLDRYKLNAEECLFIDDDPSEENYKIANKIGIKGRRIIPYQAEDIRKLLLEFGIEI